MKPKNTLLLLASTLAVLATPAFAQGETYDLKTLNFDLWCQETQHLAPDRCDRRSPSDDADFEAYRAKVEKYEISYMRGRNIGQQLDRAILHNDPVDNPVTKDPSAAAQSASSPALPPKP